MNASENRLLAALPRQEYQRLIGTSAAVNFSKNRVLYDSFDVMRNAIFPYRGLVSVQALSATGDTIEIAVVGREGFIGVPLILGAHASCYRIVARTQIEAVSVAASILKEQFSSSDNLRQLLLEYTNVLQTQLAQAVVCRIWHTVQQRMARWLLATSDCLESFEFKVTHTEIAAALGKHRNSIGGVTGDFQKRGLIASERCSIRIMDREGLRAIACECYGIVKQRIDQIGQG